MTELRQSISAAMGAAWRHGEYNKDRAIDAIQAVFEQHTRPAPAVTVKPLVWVEDENYLRAYDPELRLGYEIQRRKDGSLWARAPHNDWMPAEEKDAIKLAAFMQKDYERRILSAIQPEAMRCAECDCTDGGTHCNWMKENYPDTPTPAPQTVQEAVDWEGFGRDVMKDHFEAWDLDNADRHVMAIKHGLLKKIPGGFDPDNEQHHAADEYGADPGDDWYEPTYSALSDTPAPLSPKG